MRQLDQHFTNADEAKQLTLSLVERYDPARVRYYLEPSCGGGAFVDALLAAGVPRNQIRSTDVDVTLPADVHGDFLESTRISLRIAEWPHKSTVVIGNPPFGRNSDDARKFLNKATDYGRLIAFIVPRGMQGANCCGNVHPNLGLLYEEQAGAFDTTTARCNWQVWFLGNEPAYRPKPVFDARGLYEFVEPEEADVVIRRVGSRAGLVEPFNGKGEDSLYFIRATSTTALRALRRLNPQGLENWTTHQLSLSKPALQSLLEKQLLEDAIAKAAQPPIARWCLAEMERRYSESAAGLLLPEGYRRQKLRCYAGRGMYYSFQVRKS
ncbi:MAG: hypothetical protein ACLP9L_21965 [Thermoguttaceae bacterium]